MQPIPDAERELQRAWQETRPGTTMLGYVQPRINQFDVEALLLSAGMFGNDPLPPAIAYHQHALAFTDNVAVISGAERASAVHRLVDRIEADRFAPQDGTSANCGLFWIRTTLRASPVDAATYLLSGAFPFIPIGPGADPNVMRSYWRNLAMQYWVSDEGAIFPEGVLGYALTHQKPIIGTATKFPENLRG
jgi:hypothetical protein